MPLSSRLKRWIQRRIRRLLPSVPCLGAGSEQVAAVEAALSQEGDPARQHRGKRLLALLQANARADELGGLFATRKNAMGGVPNGKRKRRAAQKVRRGSCLGPRCHRRRLTLSGTLFLTRKRYENGNCEHRFTVCCYRLTVFQTVKRYPDYRFGHLCESDRSVLTRTLHPGRGDEPGVRVD